jgi:protein ImuB
MRIAALRVPDFPLQALRRSSPELAEAPLAIAAGLLPRDSIVCVSAEAAELGARAGTTAAQLRQAAPAVLVRMTPEAATAAADEALADAAGGFSPRIRRHAPGEVLLDVGGLVPRFGSEDHIAHELLRACRHVGLEATVGIASSVGVARVAARCTEPRVGASFASGNSLPASGGGTGGHEAAEGVRGAAGPPASGVGAALAAARRGDAVIVRPGEERAFMAPLPLAALRAVLETTPETVAMLARWGLADAGGLARLPRREVALRLGSEGAALHRLACGEETAAFIPDPMREVLREGVEVDDPIGALEPFLFVASGLLARLERRLELRGEGFAEILLELRLEGGGHREHRITLVAPTREVPAVLALVRLQLEASPPGAPMEGVAALVTPGRVRLTQGSLFGAPLPAPGKLSTALARLAALAGPDRVGSPGVPDTHRPGAWTLTPFVLENRAPGPGHRTTGIRAPGPGLRTAADPPTLGAIPALASRSPAPGALAPVLKAFRPPRRAQVVTVDGRPVVARVDGMGGSVVGCAGPYRFAGEWWGDAPFAREEFDVATADGSLLRVAFDRLERRWFADGVYD